MSEIKNTINQSENDLLADIAQLIKVPSVRDLTTKRKNAPFGQNIRRAMDVFMEIAQKLGYETYDVDGYAVYAELGHQKDYIGILGHLDVVTAEPESEWDYPPYELTRVRDRLYGRGVNDDKGPLIASLYAAKMAYDSVEHPKRAIRVIAGGAEETTWECMDHYFSLNEQPVMAFSPDGNFPVVNGEKGVLQLTLTFNHQTKATISSSPEANFICGLLNVDDTEYFGDNELSRNPQRGTNAIDVFMDQQIEECAEEDWYQFIKDTLYRRYDGSGLGLAANHHEMGLLTVSMMSLKTIAGTPVLTLDFRYPVSVDEETIVNQLKTFGQQYHFHVEVMKSMRPLYVDKDSELIHKLLDAYEEVTGDKPTPITKGGASYARSLKNGVAFGATFEGEDPRPHKSNETMKLSSLKKAMSIYVRAIKKLIV